MKYFEKLDYIQSNHMGEWIKVRQETDEEVSKEHELFCVCKRLCTGFHESSCMKFKNKVNRRAVKKLQHLIPKLTALTDSESMGKNEK